MEANMIAQLPELETHFCEKVLACALRLQSANVEDQSSSDIAVSVGFSATSFGEELLRCIENMPAAQVTYG